MKLKKLLIGSLLCLLVFFIYLSTVDKKVYYLNLGDAFALGVTPYGNEDYGYSDYVRDYLKNQGVLETYVSSFAQKDYRTTDLIRDIKENKKIEKTTIKNALIKADLVTLSIGFLDLYSKTSVSSFSNVDYNSYYEYANKAFVDLNELFGLLREYCKEDIMMIGYYNPKLSDEKEEEFYHFLNQKLEELCQKYEISFIDVYELFQENHDSFLPNPNSIFPSKVGYEIISKEIITNMEQKILK